jgi:hypothetical protein
MELKQLSFLLNLSIFYGLSTGAKIKALAHLVQEID